jgi:transposase
MAVPVALRTDYDGAALRSRARQSKDGPQTRRLLALAMIYDGGPRSEAARIGGVGLQTVRDWVLRFNACGPAGLVDRKPPGQPALLSEEHRRQLSALIEAGPIPAVHGVVRWRLVDLIQWLWEEHRIAISKQTLSRELRALDFRKLSARPRHYAKSDEAARLFKRTSPPA